MTTDPADLGIVPPDPDAAPAPAKKASKRPTTRAGRRAAAAARQAGTPGPDKPPAKKSTPSKPRKSDLETRLAGSLTTVGLGVAAAGGLASPTIQRDGIIIITNAPPIAKALADIAAGNPAVAANLERILTAGTYAALAGALMPLVIAIGANHGVIPAHVAELVGVELPDMGSAMQQAAGTPPPSPGSVPLA